MDTDRHTDEEIKEFYNLKNIAVVGMSKNEEKPSHFVPNYLIKNGYHIIPVNPTTEEILERKSYKHVSQVNPLFEKDFKSLIFLSFRVSSLPTLTHCLRGGLPQESPMSLSRRL